MENKTDKQFFYKTLVSLAVPITLQNTITSSLNLVDTVMIGQLGTVEVAAVGLANKVCFVLILVLFAISSGTAIFTAQFWGRKDVENIGRVMGIALVLSVAISILFSIFTLWLPEAVIGIFTPDQAVIADASLYLVIISFSFVPMAVTMLYAFVLRSTGRVLLPMYASIGALGLNTFLNYCLIFGHFGMPALGVKGAAIATLFARFIEAGLIILITYWKKYPAVRPGHLATVSKDLVRRFFVTALPVIANELIWVLGMTMYAVIYARMGTEEIAAVNIIGPVEHITIGFFFGLASAASVMIGNQIGRDNDDAALSYAKRFCVFGVVGAVISGIIIFFTASPVAMLFKVSPAVQDYTIKLLVILSIVLWVRIFNLVSIVGILRGGGDTKFSLYLEIIAIWAIGVPLAFFGGLVWKLEVYWVFALVHVEEGFKMIIGLYRIYSRKWIHNLVSQANPDQQASP